MSVVRGVIVALIAALKPRDSNGFVRVALLGAVIHQSEKKSNRAKKVEKDLIFSAFFVNVYIFEGHCQYSLQ